MAQAGYTPIQLYYSSTTTNAPTAGNLASGELAINITDGKLFYKDNGGSVQVIAWKTTPTTAGGTGLTSWTAGDLPYYATGTTLSKLGIGTAGQVLTSTGTAPQWSTLSGVAVTTFSAGTTGFTPSSATSGAVTLAGTLATTNGGTGLTSFTANGVFYASSTSAIGQSANLTFDGTNFVLGSAGAIRTSNASGYFETQLSYYLNAGGGGGFQLKGLGSGVAGIKFMDAADSTELMRLTSTGLGIGTSSPLARLTVSDSSNPNSGTMTLGNNASFNGTLQYLIGPGELRISQVGSSSLGTTFYTNGAERMRLDASGNLGLGVTPSAWGSGGKPLQAGNASFWGLVGTATFSSVGANYFYDGVYKYISNGVASDYYQLNGAHGWRTAASGTAGNTISFTTAMLLDAGGSLAIANTSPSSYQAVARQLVIGTTGSNGITVVSGTTEKGNLFFADGTTGADGYQGFLQYDHSTNSLNFGTVATERARIDSGGNLLVGTTSGLSVADRLTVVGGNIAVQRTSGITTFIGDSTQAGYAGTATNHAFALLTNSIERARIDSSGNLGLGVTPSAWQSTRKAFQIGTTGSLVSSSSNTIVGDNWYADSGGTNRYLVTGLLATVYQQTSGVHYWYNAPSGTAGNAISFTQAMTLDAPVTPRLLIGTTTAGVGGNNNTNLTVAGGATVYQSLIASGSQEIYLFAQSGLVGLFARSNDPMLFGTNNTERARITSVGNFSLGGTVDRGTTVGTNAIQIFNGTAPAGTLTNGVSLYSQSGDLRFMDAAGNAYQVGFRNVPQSGSAKTGSYTLATTDVGEFIQISTGGSITIPTSTFAAGDVVSLFNNTTGNITITCSAPTAYIAGANTVVTSVTLATRGVATVLFITATLCVITGNVS